jgi:hypothetical protein
VGKTERKQAGVRDEFQEAGKLVVTYPKPPKRQAVLSPQFKLGWSVPSPTAKLAQVLLPTVPINCLLSARQCARCSGSESAVYKANRTPSSRAFNLWKSHRVKLQV